MAKKTSKAKKTVKAAKAKARKTWITLILDESGSMEGTRDLTIDSVNEYIGSLKKKTPTALFSLTKFNSVRVDLVQSGVPMKDAARLTRDTYRPDQCTPLFDAVCDTISAIREELGPKPKRSVLVVVVTDGQENQSRRYKREDAAAMIRKAQADGWTFAYLGADHDIWAAASSIGISPANAVKYDKNQTRTAMRGLASATMRYDAGADASAPLFTVAEKKAIEGTTGA